MRALSTISAVVALTAASMASAAVQYTLTDLGTLGGSYSRGYGINAANEVAGTSYLTGSSTLRAFTSDGTANSASGLGTLGGSHGYGMGVSNAGVTVGFADTPTRGVAQAYSATGAVVTSLHASVSAGGVHSRAFGVNDAGDIVGHSSVASNAAFQAYYLPAGSPVTQIPTLAGYASGLASSVNSNGLVAGFAYNGNWNYSTQGTLLGGIQVTAARAFLFDSTSSSITDLGTLGGAGSIATAINDAGTIVGQAQTAGGQWLAYQRAANGSPVALNQLAGTTTSIASDVNASGDVVGSVTTAAGQRAFLYRAGQMIDLNSLVAAPGWNLVSADSINDLGYITGYATVGSQTKAFVLSPTSGASVPEPTTGALLSLAALPLLARRRRA